MKERKRKNKKKQHKSDRTLVHTYSHKIAQRFNDNSDKRAKTCLTLKGDIVPSIAINNWSQEQEENDRNEKAYNTE
jgi:hypothetical protein